MGTGARAELGKLRASVPVQDVELSDEADRFFSELEAELGVGLGARLRLTLVIHLRVFGCPALQLSDRLWTPEELVERTSG